MAKVKLTTNLGERTLSNILKILIEVADRYADRVLGPRPPRALLTFRFRDGQSTTGDIKMQQLGDANFVTGTLTPLDSRGNPVPLDKVENIQFSGSDPALITVTQNSTDPSKFQIDAVGPLGTCQFQWQYDNLTGEGGAIISGAVDMEIISGQAVGAGVTFDEQQPQP